MISQISILKPKICQNSVHKIRQKFLQKICPKICLKNLSKIFQKICQKIFQKIFQKICPKSLSKISQKTCQKYFKKSVKKSIQKLIQKMTKLAINVISLYKFLSLNCGTKSKSVKPWFLSSLILCQENFEAKNFGKLKLRLAKRTELEYTIGQQCMVSMLLQLYYTQQRKKSRSASAPRFRSLA